MMKVTWLVAENGHFIFAIFFAYYFCFIPSKITINQNQINDNKTITIKTLNKKLKSNIAQYI